MTSLYLNAIGAHIAEKVGLDQAVEEGRLSSAAHEQIGLTSVAVSPWTSAPEMAVHAARAAVAEAAATASLTADSFRMLIHAVTHHQGPDGWSAPHYILNQALARPITAFELRQGCLGMVTGMGLAESLLAGAGPEEPAAVLLTSADNFSVPLVDRWTASRLFVLGDAASAVVLSNRPGFAELVSHHNMSAPEMEGMHRGAEPLYPPAVTVGRPMDFDSRSAHWQKRWAEQGEPPPGDLALLVESTVEVALAKAGLKPDQIDAVAHVGYGKQAMQALVLEPLGLGDTPTSWDLHRQVGHAGASDPFLGLRHLWRGRTVGPGDHVLLLAAGPGMEVASAVVRIIEAVPAHSGPDTKEEADV
ncbi:ketoacyl-ACP synthase III family protein [Myceligenerans cantabricum]